MTRHLLLLGIWLLGFSSARGAEFVIDPTATTDTVYFRSTAKLEFIEGKTTIIDGHFSCIPAHLDSGIAGVVKVDLRTLKTGIDTRDEHMRERHLHTEEYPFAYFELASLSGIGQALGAGATDSGAVDGWFYIHGVKRKLQAAIWVTYQPEPAREKVTIRTKFQLLLDEYDIPRPKALFMKLAEKIDVECIFSAYNNLPETNISLPDWPAKD
jgi:polyisoprenoid-binding protein YceI